jgi:hypothetical protein
VQGASGEVSFALVRYEGWLKLLWAHAVCLAAVAGIVRCVAGSWAVLQAAVVSLSEPTLQRRLQAVRCLQPP